MARNLLTLCLVATFAVSGCGGGGEGTTGGNGGEGGGSAAASGPALPEGAVLPTPETIESGEYTPLSRPLFLYVSKKSLSRPETVAFLRYYLSDEAIPLVEEVGYVRLSESQLAETRKTLEDAIAEAGAAAEGDLSGSVTIDGSSTVYPISQAVAEEFSKANSGVRVPVGTSGTGGGFKKFIAGETDINDASRPIKDSEAEACKKAGIDFIELKVAIDGLTVVVNPENDWVSGMSIEQLKTIWEPGSEIKKWNEVDPSWPDEEIKLFGPDTDSGTFDYFTEVVCGEGGACRSDYQQSADDNFLVTGVAGDKYALGYFGYAYYVENQEKVKPLGIVEE